MARDDFYLTAEQREMRELVRAIARDRIAPLAAHVDEAEVYPDESLKFLGDQGLMGLYIPERYGGTDMGTLAFCLAVEEIAWACASSATIYLVQYAGGWPIVAAGSDATCRASPRARSRRRSRSRSPAPVPTRPRSPRAPCAKVTATS
jgi:butyryl-CoA dehydrogenase